MVRLLVANCLKFSHTKASEESRVCSYSSAVLSSWKKPQCWLYDFELQVAQNPKTLQDDACHLRQASSFGITCRLQRCLVRGEE